MLLSDHRAPFYGFIYAFVRPTDCMQIYVTESLRRTKEAIKFGFYSSHANNNNSTRDYYLIF